MKSKIKLLESKTVSAASPRKRDTANT